MGAAQFGAAQLGAMSPHEEQLLPQTLLPKCQPWARFKRLACPPHPQALAEPHVSQPANAPQAPPLPQWPQPC